MKMPGWKLFLAGAAALCVAASLSLAGFGGKRAEAEESAFRQATQFGFSDTAIQGGVLLGDVPAGTASLALDGAPVSFAEDGRFLIAFNRDHGQSSRLVATLDDGSKVSKFISVAPREWKIEHVNVAKRGGGSSETWWNNVRKPEWEAINAARAKVTAAQGWRQDFVWPAKGRISGLFGSQRIYRGEPGSYHSGLDIAGATGTHFVAPADGVVILAADQPFSLEGRLLMIDHGMGLNSAFLHCSEILVEEGQAVKRGEPIGRIGATGRATGPHLHWSMKWNDARIDPILLVGPMQ